MPPANQNSETRVVTETPKILIVDDEEIIGDILRRRFERLGFDVIIALGGRQAMNFLEHHTPALVVCDAILQDEVASNEVLDATRHLHPNAKFVVMSGHLRTDEALSFITGRDISLFIKKPFSSLSSVVTQLADLLERNPTL